MDKNDIAKKFEIGETFSIRPSEEDRFIISTLLKETHLNKSQIFRLGLYSMIERFTRDLVYKGIDFKELAKINELRLLRKMESIKKTEKISGDLFINRVKKDIIKYLWYNKSDEQIMGMIEEQKNIAKTYSKEKVKEIERLVEENTPGKDSKLFKWYKLKKEFSSMRAKQIIDRGKK